MNATIRLTLTAAGFALGCAPSGSTVGNVVVGAGNEVAAVTVYEFAQHGPAAQVTTAVTDGLGCARSCLATWSSQQKDCTGIGAIACRANVTASASACVETLCYEAPTLINAPKCTLGCAKEAAIAERDCTGAGCSTEAEDVYAVCYDATCRDGNVALRLTEQLASALLRPESDGPVAAEEVAGFDCSQACAAFDVSVYLRCVDDNPADPTSCRERNGETYEACMAQRCPAQ
jgi:hypothetical protein